MITCSFYISASQIHIKYVKEIEEIHRLIINLVDKQTITDNANCIMVPILSFLGAWKQLSTPVSTFKTNSTSGPVRIFQLMKVLIRMTTSFL